MARKRITEDRIGAYRCAMLNTLVRMARTVLIKLGQDPSLVTRSSCLSDVSFRRFSSLALDTKLFKIPIEGSMEEARKGLLKEIMTLGID